MTFTFAGIGSRETPERYCNTLFSASKRLAELGFLLHSGGADGADTACEKGAIAGMAEGDSPKIFLPWKGFNQNKSELYTVSEDAIEMGMYYHPIGTGMSIPMRKIMGRNCYQVLGQDLQTPVDFILCWTEGGKDIGGTGQALRIARDRDIFICNVYNRNALDKLAKYLTILGVEGLKT